MKILALDTSTKVASVAIIDQDKMLAEYFVNTDKMNHSQKLMPVIDGVIKDLGIDLREIDYYAVSVGPGSFTGLRIGVATVKGMAYANNKKVVAVDTLDAIANNVSYSDDIVCCIMDARNRQVYVAMYDGKKKIVEDTAIDIDELIDKLIFLGTRIIFVGDGVLVYSEYLKEKLQDNFVMPRRVDVLPRASSVAELALGKIQNQEILSCEDLVPNYLRKSQAEREYEKNHKKGD
ncbi:MAG: tRNA (adenosine(37)-N6)-threonylcarbamoyltransferase complex dimerization subunit type 1 TsaB [Clostridiales bacterium]|nr:tRNA (adenosine(37)-N6)-threonylcarbamoyltransferase complex dimerization subunit type 1 TsaB [Clostridiales bacterium]